MTALPSANRTEAGAPSGRVLPALAEASRRTGISFDALFRTARLESGLNPDARARTSSATGLFQFVDSTWLQTLARHGAQHGIAPTSRQDALALRKDPYTASLMAAHHMADNAALLSARTGRPPGQVELYLAHFLGASGAADFLEQLAQDPDQPAATLMPAAARANRSVFYAGGQPRTLSEIHHLFARKLASAAPPDGPSAMAPNADHPDSARSLGHVPSSIMADSAREAAGAVQTARLAYLLLADLGA